MIKNKHFGTHTHDYVALIWLVTAADELDAEFLFLAKAITLVQPLPRGVSVGVSEAAARPRGNVHFIQLPFHVTELLSAATDSQSLKFSSFYEG